jgi:hypothetical protein
MAAIAPKLPFMIEQKLATFGTLRPLGTEIRSIGADPFDIPIARNIKN